MFDWLRALIRRGPRGPVVSDWSYLGEPIGSAETPLLAAWKRELVRGQVHRWKPIAQGQAFDIACECSCHARTCTRCGDH